MSIPDDRELIKLIRDLRTFSDDMAVITLGLRLKSVHNAALDSAALVAMGKAVDMDVEGSTAKEIGQEIKYLQWN